MTNPGASPGATQDAPHAPADAIGITLLRRRGGLIAGLGLVGLLAGLAAGLLTPRQYVASAMFIPQSQEAGSSGLELAASQFGIRLPTTSGAWGTPIYAELLYSRMLLEPIALDTVTVQEEGGRRVAMMDLLGAPALPTLQRTEVTVRLLRQKVLATEDKKLGAVRLTVTTRWPSVSLAVAQRLVSGVDRFNLETRKTQATQERRFVEDRATEAESTLREAEDRLQAFRQENRSIAGSPELTFAEDRLQREVELRQSVLTSLLQRREEARIKEIRDLPVVTVIESPRLPVAGEPRRSLMKGVLGAFAATGLAFLLAFVLEGLADARRDSPESSRGVVGTVHALLRFRLRARR